MTEFFNHLIARSGALPVPQGQGNALLPRLPSLFEAPGFQAAASGEESAGGAQEGARHEIPSGPYDRADRSRRSFPQEGELQSDTNRSLEPPRGQGTEADEPDHRRSRASGERRDQREGDAEQFRTSAPGIPVIPRETFVLESAQKPAQQSRGPAPDPRSKPALQDAAAQPATGSPIRPVVSVRSPGPDQPHPSRPFAGRGEGNEAGGLDAWRSQPPTVRISIGRIEVRAVPAAAQPPARPPAAARPKLTLDEYLRQRNEGKR